MSSSFPPTPLSNIPPEVLDWAQRGFSVLPTTYHKRPATGTGGWKNASRDIDTLALMNWSRNDLRFGVALGPQDVDGKVYTLIGLDFDGPKDQQLSAEELRNDPAGYAFAEFAAELGGRAILQRTPRGGRLLFLTDQIVRRATGKEAIEGSDGSKIEILSVGHTVVHGTNHYGSDFLPVPTEQGAVRSGAYETLSGGELCIQDLALVPAETLDKIRRNVETATGKITAPAVQLPSGGEAKLPAHLLNGNRQARISNSNTEHDPEIVQDALSAGVNFAKKAGKPTHTEEWWAHNIVFPLAGMVARENLSENQAWGILDQVSQMSGGPYVQEDNRRRWTDQLKAAKRRLASGEQVSGWTSIRTLAESGGWPSQTETGGAVVPPRSTTRAPTLDELAEALTSAPIVFELDERADQKVYTLRDDIPGLHLEKDKVRQPLDEVAKLELAAHIERMFGRMIPQNRAFAAIDLVANRGQGFDAVQEILANLPAPRPGDDYYVDNWLHLFCGADDTPHNRALSRSIIHMLLLRALFPGCVMDRVPVLYGDGGIGKSPLLKLMAFGRPELFTDGETLMQAKAIDLIAVVGAAWVVEIPEAGGMSKKDKDIFKMVVGQVSDKTRKHFSHDAFEKPRRFAPIVTANPGTPLPDLGDDDKRLIPTTLHGIPLPPGTPARNPRTGKGIDLVAFKQVWPRLLAHELPYIKNLPREESGLPLISWPDELRDSEVAAQYKGEDPLRETIESLLVSALTNGDKSPTPLTTVAGQKAIASETLHSNVTLSGRVEAMNYQHRLNRTGEILRDLGFTRKKSNKKAYWILPDDLETRLGVDQGDETQSGADVPQSPQ